MRLYTFCNYYLNSISQGIQTAHVVAELYNDWASPCESEQFDQLDLWAHNHKTIIVLNGGNHQSLTELADLFDTADNPYPWAAFREDEASLNNAVTCVGIIVPGVVYETAEAQRNKELIIVPALSQFDWALVNQINDCSLAR